MTTNSTDEPLVYVVVLNWNGLADTTRCLQSLRGISYQNYKVVVVDNGSDNDEGQELLERFSGIELIQNDHDYGFAGGCNPGIRHALASGANYVLLLSNDCVVDPAFLTHLVQSAEVAQNIGAVGPKTYYMDRPGVIRSVGGKYNLWIGWLLSIGDGEIDRGQFDNSTECGYLEGACLLMRREAVDRVGLLDEEYFAYWEDADWGVRARRAGYRIMYVPQARIWHKVNASFTSSERHYLGARNRVLFMRKQGRWYHLISFLVAHYLVHAPLFLLKHPSAVARIPVEMRAFLWSLRTRRLFKAQSK